MLKRTLIAIATATASLAIFALPSVAQEIRAPSADRASSLCLQTGYEPGQLEYLYCVESLRESAGNMPLSHRSGYYAEAAPMNGDRYLAETGFYGGARINGVCAGIGLPANSQAFRQCVGNLDASMLDIQNSGLTE